MIKDSHVIMLLGFFQFSMCVSGVVGNAAAMFGFMVGCCAHLLLVRRRGEKE